MISHEGKFIFIDICKCAGTSIISALGEYFECSGKHHSISNITGDYSFCSNLSTEEIGGYFKFTFVRNPYDRLLSVWLWGHSQGHMYREYSFREFVIGVRDGIFEEYNRHRYIPMIDWLRDGDGRIRIDFIGKYENLAVDFSELCGRLGIGDVVLSKWNVSRARRSHYRGYYDAETREIVSGLYAEDFEVFGYSF